MLGISFRPINNLYVSHTRSFVSTVFPRLNASLLARATLAKGQKKLADEQKQIAEKKKAIAKEKKQLKQLKGKLSKEKSTLSKLKSQYQIVSKKLKDKEKRREQRAKDKLQAQKAKENEKRLVAAATKPFRRLSAYNYFIKENASTTKSLKDVTSSWKALSESEKEQYKNKANKFNEEQLKVYTPRPKAPANGYAAYVQENYVKDGRPFGEINKELAAEWKALGPHEKARYSIPKSTKDEYVKNLKEWTEQRIKLYKESKAKPSA